MPRRRRSMAPSRSSRSAVQRVQPLFLFGGFFLGAQIDAAQLLALALQLLDALVGMFERRASSSPSLISARSGKFLRRRIEFVADAVAQVRRCARRRLPNSACARARSSRAAASAVSAALAALSASASTAFGARARIGCLVAGRFGGGRWRRAALLRLAAIVIGHGFGVAEFGAPARRGGASSSSICALAAAVRALPSARVRRRWRRGARARISPSRVRPSSVARASLIGGARFGGARRARRQRVSVSAAPSANAASSRSRLTFGFARGIVRLREAADFGFERGELGDALGGDACGLSLPRFASQAGHDRRGVARLRRCARFRALRRFGLGRGIDRKQLGAMFLGARDFAFERGKTVALRQAHGGCRRRIGRRGISIPAPQIAALRDEPLAGLECGLQRAPSLIGTPRRS